MSIDPPRPTGDGTRAGDLTRPETAPEQETPGPIFTSLSPDSSRLVTKPAVLQANLFYMNETALARVDLHCHSTASQVSRLGVQRAVGLPECATPPQEVYELAKRRGMDFVTITDHDTIDGVLQIADRPDVFISEELTAHFRGEPQAVHVLCYGITPGRPRVAAGPQRRRRGMRRVHERARDRLRARTPLLHRRRAADRAPPPAPGRHVRDLGDPQRRARARAQPARRDLRQHPQRHRHRRQRRPRRRRHRPHLHRDPARAHPGRAARAPARRTHHRARRAGQRRQVGARRDRARRAHARQRSDGGAPTPSGGAPDPRTVLTMAERLLREGDARHGAAGNDLTPADARQPAARLAGRGRARRARRARPHRLHAGRALQPRRSAPPRLSRPRAQAARRRRVDRPRRRRPQEHARGERQRLVGKRVRDRRHRCAGRRDVGLRGLHRRDPLRAGRRLPRQREGQARLRARASSHASRSWPTGSAARTASRARSRRSASAASRASRSRSSAPTPTSTAGSPRSPRSTCPSTPGCASACPPCRPPSRRSPRAPSTRSTSARPDPSASPAR